MELLYVVAEIEAFGGRNPFNVVHASLPPRQQCSDNFVIGSIDFYIFGMTRDKYYLSIFPLSAPLAQLF